jgi:hypothetical protein
MRAAEAQGSSVLQQQQQEEKKKLASRAILA